MCLNANGAGPETLVDVYACNFGVNQGWALGGPNGEIVNLASGYCLFRMPGSVLESRGG